MCTIMFCKCIDCVCVCTFLLISVMLDSIMFLNTFFFIETYKLRTQPCSAKDIDGKINCFQGKTYILCNLLYFCSHAAKAKSFFFIFSVQ